MGPSAKKVKRVGGWDHLSETLGHVKRWRSGGAEQGEQVHWSHPGMQHLW